jgi:hypothetical protein
MVFKSTRNSLSGSITTWASAVLTTMSPKIIP